MEKTYLFKLVSLRSDHRIMESCKKITLIKLVFIPCVLGPGWQAFSQENPEIHRVREMEKWEVRGSWQWNVTPLVLIFKSLGCKSLSWLEVKKQIKSSSQQFVPGSAFWFPCSFWDYSGLTINPTESFMSSL